MAILAIVVTDLAGNTQSSTQLKEGFLAMGSKHINALHAVVDNSKGNLQQPRFGSAGGAYGANKQYLLSDGQFIYAFSADEELTATQARAILDSIQKSHAKSSNTSLEDIRSNPEQYSKSQFDAKVEAARKGVSAVKDVMIQNIDQVLERGEAIEKLVYKSEDLEHHATIFAKKAKGLNLHMFFKDFCCGLCGCCASCSCCKDDPAKAPLARGLNADMIRDDDSCCKPPTCCCG